MKLAEDQAKKLLADRGIAVPKGEVVSSPDEARQVARQLGPKVAVKALVRSGGRGKQGGVVIASDPDRAAQAAAEILGSELGGEIVMSVLVEQGIDIAAERYLSLSIDPSRGRPVIMRSDQGGVDIEAMTDQIESVVITPQSSHDDLSPIETTLVEMFHDLDALLIEINPLAETRSGELIAVDAKIELDDSARFRHIALFDSLSSSYQPLGTERELAAAEMGLRLIELGGDIAVLANGAGLTMATMDAIEALGGAPANFLEIGGDAYTKATPALQIVLSQPGIRSLLVNFCGAFARCDVMTAGVLDALDTLKPDLPVVFSISGTGMDEAQAMVRDRLGVEPHATMHQAVAAAVSAAAARGGDNHDC